MTFAFGLVRRVPNKRLKLAGGDRSNGNGVLCPDGHELSFHDRCAGGRVGPQLKRDPLDSTSTTSQCQPITSFTPSGPR